MSKTSLAASPKNGKVWFSVSHFEVSALGENTRPPDLDLLEGIRAVKEQFGDYEGEAKILGCKNAPIYLQRAFRRVQRRFMDNGENLSHGEGLTACLYYGAKLFIESDPAQAFCNRIRQSELLEGLSAFDEGQLDLTTEDFRFKPNDLGSGFKQLSFRCHPAVFQYVVDTSHALRIDISSLVVPSIMRGLAFQPGVNFEGSEAMLLAFEELGKLFEKREGNLARFIKGLTD